MFFDGSANSEQLEILTAVVRDHCRERDIEPGSQEGEDVGRLVMSLYSNGARTSEQLRARLALLDGPERRPAS